MDAAQLGSLPPLFGRERASTVISGLPLLSMPPAHVASIIQGVFEQQLQPEGSLYQFTYGHRCPLPRQLLEQLDLEVVRIGSVFFNLPPATVYRIRHRRRKRVAA
jgi:phospholipid N-methyltransferase